MFDSDEELRNHYRALLAFFRARLSVHHRKFAEDLAQETLMAAVHRGRTSNPEPVANLPGFLLGIARHKLQDHLDHAQKQPPTVSIDGALDTQHFEPIAEVVSDNRAEEAAQLREFGDALRHLSVDERELLILRFVDRLSNADAADRLGLDPDDASRVKYRAIEKIRRRISDNRGRPE